MNENGAKIGAIKKPAKNTCQEEASTIVEVVRQ